MSHAKICYGLRVRRLKNTVDPVSLQMSHTASLKLFSTCCLY